MVEITKLPFEKGSPLNFLFLARMKRGFSQKKVAKIIGKSMASFSNYENGTCTTPKKTVVDIQSALNFSAYEKQSFKKFLLAVDKKRTERGVVGVKNHASYKKGTSKKRATPKRVSKNKAKRTTGLSTETKKVILFLDKALKSGLKEDLRWLRRVRKIAQK